MPPIPDLPTHFAPASRSEPPEVSRQAAAVERHPELGHLLDHIPDLLLVLNRHRQAVFSNQKLLELLELEDFSPLLGQRPGEILNCIHSREMPGGCGTSQACQHCGAVLAILAGLEGQRAVQECRLTVRRAEGILDCLDLQVWASPLEVGGEPYTFLAISDLSDQKRRRALERIFFHDLLNTAGGLLNLTELLQEPDRHDVTKLTSSLHLAAERLVQEILAQRELSAAESHELQVSPRAFFAGAFLNRQLQIVACHPMARQSPLELRAPALEEELVTDQALLGRVLLNLLKNSLEASLPGQGVSAGFQAKDGGVEFWVHNQTDMPPEVQLQVFNRSFSTKGPGRGLGTYSVKLFTERYLEGRVGFTSSPEEGTTFRVWVPRSLPA
ncbi:MAG: HAMP domain-containing histidine kinase [Deltaproteobacteria bacterium]|nr:HAMP domain-containing histidine kinase [Deltaproteobacteria bacterium]